MESIHVPSFIYGMVTAFGECVAAEAKKLAFSPPFKAEYLATITPEVERIMADMGLKLYFEENADIPEADRVYWWVMYKFPEDLQEYLDVRAKGFNPAWEFAAFRDMLSYGTVWGENYQMVKPKMKEPEDCMGPVGRIIFADGGWPIPKK